MYTAELTPITGEDVNRIRAALNLLRSDFAEVLGVHPATVSRWEARQGDRIAVAGIPRDLLLALRDQIVVRHWPLDRVRPTGRFVQQCLLRKGRLAAVGELIRFASAAPMRWPGERESDFGEVPA
jgi:Helix-turn-helix